jgi:hypothetical protein
LSFDEREKKKLTPAYILKGIFSVVENLRFIVPQPQRGQVEGLEEPTVFRQRGTHYHSWDLFKKRRAV